jgi:hypothetical protein
MPVESLQIRGQDFLELESSVAEMCFDRAFGAFQTFRYRFDGHFVFVIEAKDKTADGGQVLECCLKEFLEFGAFDKLTWTGMRLCFDSHLS